MIINWDRYVKNALPIGLRKPKLIQLVTVLLSGITSRYSDLLNYMDKARLYASCTWQVCWLEFMLRLELDNETINIQEGDGLPYDFEIYGVPYADSSRVIGIIGRFKLAGKSFHINLNDIDQSAMWIDPVCEKENVIISSVKWINPVCAKNYVAPLEFSVVVQWSDGSSGSTDGFGGSIALKNSSNSSVDSENLTTYSKTASKLLTAEYQSGGFKVDLSRISAYKNGTLVEVHIRWSLSPDMSNPTYDNVTGMYSENKTIYVQVQTTNF